MIIFLIAAAFSFGTSTANTNTGFGGFGTTTTATTTGFGTFGAAASTGKGATQ